VIRERLGLLRGLVEAREFPALERKWHIAVAIKGKNPSRIRLYNVLAKFRR